MDEDEIYLQADEDEDEDEDDESISVAKRLDSMIFADNKHEFVSIIKNQLAKEQPVISPSKLHPHAILWKICRLHAVHCAAALINGETGQTLDLNVPCTDGFFPIHHAAQSLSPELTELFLVHGARTDLRSKHDLSAYNEKLPLSVGLQILRTGRTLCDWTPLKSVFKLLILLCLPRLRHALETIGLLAWCSKETEEEILHYARDGKLVELAALLIVARGKLSAPARECILPQVALPRLEEPRLMNDMEGSNFTMPEDKKAVLMSVSLLVEVFEKAGDAIEAYVKQDKMDLLIMRGQVIGDVAGLLQQAGFVLKDQDTNLNDIHWFEVEEALKDDVQFRERIMPYKDLDMPHCSKSGLRWIHKMSNEKSVASVPIGLWKPVSVPSRSAVLSPSVRLFHSVQVLKACKLSETVKAQVKNPMKGVESSLPNVISSKPWAQIASVIKRGLRHI